MASKKNIYGLSEGVFKACQFLGLKFPPEALNKSQLVPSDYFGDDFELNDAMTKKLRAERNWSEDIFAERYKTFARHFYFQKPLKHTKTDLNVYFCDYVLFAGKILGSIADDYFKFEFYRKPVALRRNFITESVRNKILMICNDYDAIEMTNDKTQTNTFFAEFLHRDWLDTRNCTLGEFKFFVDKHPRFLAKPFRGSLGKGVEIVNVGANEDLQKLLDDLKRKGDILEEIVIQHEAIAAFCPDTVNTVRVYSFLDIHNVVHILATTGRFGRLGSVIDNVHRGDGFSAIIDPKTGIITSDGLSESHEIYQKHPDTGTTFKGFQYPCWEKLCETVAKMAKMIPRLHHIGWDIAINNRSEIVFIEANKRPDIGLQQAADSVGRLHLYKPLLEELQNYKREQMRFLGYKVNNLRNFNLSYNTPTRNELRLKFAMGKLISDCKSLIDLGCRNPQFVKSLCPEGVKYFPVDYKNFSDEVIICNFNKGEFPDIKADTCFCALTAEFVERLPKFLADVCNAAQKQILMLCRPIDKETRSHWRWKNPVLTDFTEKFLIDTIEQNKFKLDEQYPAPDNRSLIVYDFRRI
ncbi:MAG: hypothetical protein IJL14_04205 [Selenomonadaceae bacterium]|nr:hypothetical protein [Selenomonadaceae bacterium]